jgi:hypothetical protein
VVPVSLDGRYISWVEPTGLFLATGVRPHMRHVDVGAVFEPIEVSNQRLERKRISVSGGAPRLAGDPFR